MTIKVAILGCSGRMGRNLIQAAHEHEQITLVGGTVRQSSSFVDFDLGELAGIGKIEFLNDLQDVDTLTTPAEDEDHLQFNATEGKWFPYDIHTHLGLTYAPIVHTHAIADATDTIITNHFTFNTFSRNRP